MSLFDPSQAALTDQMPINVNMVLCVDGTVSMSPAISTVKKMCLTMYGDVKAAMQKTARPIKKMKIKVICFRDYYVEGALDDAIVKEGGTPWCAMYESRFFDMSDDVDRNELVRFVESIEAEGGGDEPENALEAMALACKALHEEGIDDDPSAKNRHMIVMFTDASAHRFEVSKKGKPKVYPDDMPDSLGAFKELWSGISQRSKFANYSMNPVKERLVIFAPTDKYPWKEICENWSMVYPENIAPALGGQELSKESIITLLTKSMG